MIRTRLVSLPGILLTAVLVAGVILSVWRTGGMAFSPGRLSNQTRSGDRSGGYTSHLAFETRCDLCHAPLRTTQDQLCLQCHSRIATQIQQQQGTHALIPQVNQCYRCHVEHQGKDNDLLQSSLARFDHTLTGFSLTWHSLDYNEQPLDCTACHINTPGFPLDRSSCFTCHALHAPDFIRQHSVEFGSNCLACHDGSDRMADFDHQQSHFPLTGRHASLSCVRCHLPTSNSPGVAVSFKNTSTACVDCHTEPAVHQGLFSTDCSTCHSSAGWQPALWQGQPFDHQTTTHFSLARHTVGVLGQPLTCRDCHVQDIQQAVLPICISCHAQSVTGADFISRHQDQFGSACLDCHDGVDRLSNFDHNNFFPLEGAHAALECQKCHANRVFRGTPGTCAGCHSEPPIHAGFFGVQCQDCHTTQAWTPAQLRIHSFPLNHGTDQQNDCQTCHPQAYLQYTCTNCHTHDATQIEQQHLGQNISPTDLVQCARCHPTGQGKASLRP